MDPGGEEENIYVISVDQIEALYLDLHCKCVALGSDQYELGFRDRESDVADAWLTSADRVRLDHTRRGAAIK